VARTRVGISSNWVAPHQLRIPVGDTPRQKRNEPHAGVFLWNAGEITRSKAVFNGNENVSGGFEESSQFVQESDLYLGRLARTTLWDPFQHTINDIRSTD